MSLLAWIVLGLIAGLAASKMFGDSGQDAATAIVVGVIGAVVGSWLFNSFAMAGVDGFKLYSVLLAGVGASVLLVVYHALSRAIREVLFNISLEN